MIALATNVLVYAEGCGDLSKGCRAAAVVNAFPSGQVVLPGQVLAELYRVLVGKNV